MFTTEVTSRRHASDHPLLLRTKTAYDFSEQLVQGGSVLEIGCGEGYGLRQIYQNADQLFLIDRSPYSETVCADAYPDARFVKAEVPSLKPLNLPRVDTILCFQFIEHIHDPLTLLREAYNLLNPGGQLIISTPNAAWTQIQNPWHIKEFNLKEFSELIAGIGGKSSVKGVNGSPQALRYFENSNRSAQRIARLDFLKLHRKLPIRWHQFLYDRANRINRRGLLRQTDHPSLTATDYKIGKASAETLDFIALVTKN